jgi:hypothetical protein
MLTMTTRTDSVPKSKPRAYRGKSSSIEALNR